MTISTRDNYAMNSGALAIGTTTSKVNSVAIINFVVNGRSLSKAVTADLFTLAGTALAANQVCAFFLLLDASGTASVSQSAIATASTGTGFAAGVFEWPDPLDKCVVGALLIRSGGSVFTPGTTALTSVTTYVNAAPDYSAPLNYSLATGS